MKNGLELKHTTRTAGPDDCHDCGQTFIDRRYDLPGGLSLCTDCVEQYAIDVYDI